MPTKSFSVPQSIINRLDKYKKENDEWKQFNASAVVAEALDLKLKDEGY
jgi:hypothetical protein